MPESKQIPVNTTATVVGGSITILSEYSENKSSVPFVNSCFISDEVASINGTSYIEGELIFVLENGRVQVFLNSSTGGLFIQSQDNDESLYKINSQTGQLEYYG